MVKTNFGAKVDIEVSSSFEAQNVDIKGGGGRKIKPKSCLKVREFTIR